jgi:FdhD protein
MMKAPTSTAPEHSNRDAMLGDPMLETPVERVTGHTSRRTTDSLAVEEPLEIQLAYGPSDSRSIRSISVTMRTPGDDFALAAGFLMTEGVIRDPNHVMGIAYAGYSSKQDDLPLQTIDLLNLGSKRNMVRVDLATDVPVNLGSLQRNFYTTSSCGICGKASLLALRTVCPPRAPNNFRVDAQVLYRLPERLRASQGLFDRTGGLHGAALFDSTGNLLELREDVGRHNAVDKLIGSEFLADHTPLRDRLLLLSGRASFELLQKALMGGIPMVVAVGAPSSLAFQIAKEFDITLVGFLREDRFNIYHGSHNIDGYSSTELGTAT